MTQLSASAPDRLHLRLHITCERPIVNLARIIHVFTRRRAQVSRVTAIAGKEKERGLVKIEVTTTKEDIQKIALQIDRMIDVENLRFELCR